MAGHGPDFRILAGGNQVPQRIAFELRVGIDEHEEFAGGFFDPLLERVGLAGVILADQADTGIPDGEHCVGGGVRRAVIDHQDFHLSAILRGEQGLDGF